MPDLRALADEAIHHLDRLGATILDDVGDGPRPSDLAAAASAAREAVSRLAVPALTQLTGLVANVAESLAGGATEWSPSLGGTLMSAVDDLRHLASRSAEFSDEDSEHLHHRAAELSMYVQEAGEASPVVATQSPVIPESPRVILSETQEMLSAEPGPPPSPSAQDDKERKAQNDTGGKAQDDKGRKAQNHNQGIVPIDQLFYADAGPHILSGGTPKEASRRSDLLGRGIDALDDLIARPIASPVTFAATEVVPVETLLYRGRAALERAVVLREQIKASGGAASPAALDEMYDLIGLALKD